jgi:hypothetical protein
MEVADAEAEERAFDPQADAATAAQLQPADLGRSEQGNGRPELLGRPT